MKLSSMEQAAVSPPGRAVCWWFAYPLSSGHGGPRGESLPRRSYTVARVIRLALLHALKFSANTIIFTFLCAGALLPIMAPDSSGQQRVDSLPRALDQLTKEADVIVHGYVTAARIEPHPQLKNLLTVVVSMSVKDTYKGQPQKSVVFRQYIWDLRSQLGNAEYHKGDELVLLLGPVSEYGLTSPVGLEQGRFHVFNDAKGVTVAVNGRGNAGLFTSVEQRALSQGVHLPARTAALARQPKAGPLPLADLEDAIRTFVRTR